MGGGLKNEGKRGYREKETTEEESVNSNSSLSVSESTTSLSFLRW